MVQPISTGNIRMYLASCQYCGIQGEYTSREAAENHHPHHNNSPSHPGMAAA